MSKNTTETDINSNGSKSAVERIVSRVMCWWFGCTPNHDRTYFWFDKDHCEDHLPCKRCDNYDVSYGDMVGDTRHNRFKERCNYWLFRKWIPEKCSDCGHRYKCDESIDHIPF